MTVCCQQNTVRIGRYARCFLLPQLLHGTKPRQADMPADIFVTVFVTNFVTVLIDLTFSLFIGETPSKITNYFIFSNVFCPIATFWKGFPVRLSCPNVDKREKICYNSVTIFQRSVSMAENKAAKTEGLIYKGHPLRRVDNLIYYGTMAEKYIIMMQVLDSKKEQDLNVATKVSIQLQLTDPDLKSRDRVVKKSEKDSLYAAMDIAAIWLDRALAGK